MQPVLVLCGLIVEQAELHDLTHEFLDLKHRYFGGLLPATRPYLQWILPEVKGADVRRQLRGSRRARRHATGFLDRIFELLQRHDARIIARIWVKQPGGPFDGRAVYTSSVQAMVSCFDSYLAERQAQGVVVLDSRTKNLNTQVSFSVFTEKFRSAGDKYPRVLEMPTFGHSDNHAGLQVVDLLCSALLFPISALTYCAGHVQSVHVNNRFAAARTRFGPLLALLQYRHQDADGRWRCGLTVSDAIGHRSAAALLS